MASAGHSKVGYPKQIKYIVGNEAAERFSYYGMRSILVIFMTQYLVMSQPEAKGIYHTFISANYFLPLLGAYLSDRYLGKYYTIISLSLVYCLGHAVLALWENQLGMYWGLFFIALGAGGIKPCVSAHVGDQFDKRTAHLINKVFEVFYFSINFGAFFSILLIPLLLPKFGPRVAFGVPGILMALATYVFWLGRHYYIYVPPTGKENSMQFFGVLGYAFSHLKERKPGSHWIDVARVRYSSDRVDGAKAVINVFKVLISVSAFWALFEQQGSTWTLQAQKMDLNLFGIKWEAAQIQGINPILVMVLIPLFSWWIYPAVQRLGVKVSPLRKMGTGMAMTGFSFLAAAVIERMLESGVVVNVGWQMIQYVLITGAEIMVSITGLEFAYTQAPRAMKSTIMSLWLLTVAVGNWFTAVVSYMNPFHGGTAEFLFYGGLMFVVAIVFIAIAGRYQEQSYIEDGSIPAGNPVPTPALQPVPEI